MASLLDQWVDATVGAVKYAPRFLFWDLPKAPVLDIKDAFSGDLDFERSAAIGKAIGTGLYEDFRHPLKNLPFLLMDIGGLATGGATLAARGGMAGSRIAAAQAAKGGARLGAGELARISARSLFDPLPVSKRTLRTEGGDFQRITMTDAGPKEVWSKLSGPTPDNPQNVYSHPERIITTADGRANPITAKIQEVFDRKRFEDPTTRVARFGGVPVPMGLRTGDQIARKAERDAQRIMERVARADEGVAGRERLARARDYLTGEIATEKARLAAAGGALIPVVDPRTGVPSSGMLEVPTRGVKEAGEFRERTMPVVETREQAAARGLASFPEAPPRVVLPGEQMQAPWRGFSEDELWGASKPLSTPLRPRSMDEARQMAEDFQLERDAQIKRVFEEMKGGGVQDKELEAWRRGRNRQIREQNRQAGNKDYRDQLDLGQRANPLDEEQMLSGTHLDEQAEAYKGGYRSAEKSELDRLRDAAEDAFERRMDADTPEARAWRARERQVEKIREALGRVDPFSPSASIGAFGLRRADAPSVEPPAAPAAPAVPAAPVLRQAVESADDVGLAASRQALLDELEAAKAAFRSIAKADDPAAAMAAARARLAAARAAVEEAGAAVAPLASGLDEAIATLTDQVRQIEARLETATGGAVIGLRRALAKKRDELADLLWQKEQRAGRGGTPPAAAAVPPAAAVRAPQPPPFVERAPTPGTPEERVAFYEAQRAEEAARRAKPEQLPPVEAAPPLYGDGRNFYGGGMPGDEQRLARLEAELEALKRQDGKAAPPVDGRHWSAKVVDAINQATTLGVLHLKPGYVPPNMLGQGALLLTQHHFNPIEIARTVAMERRLFGAGTQAFGIGTAARKFGKQGDLAHLVPRIDAGTGDTTLNSLIPSESVGIPERAGNSPLARAAHSSTRGVARVHKHFADWYSSFLDAPWRRAAFLYEARRAGYDTPELLEDLVMNPANRDDFVRVSRQAGKAMIDFGNLNHIEREYIRRMIFFYPWIKGSTQYAGRFIGEHPMQASIQLQGGRMSEERTAEELGPIPSYLEGIFRIGSRNVPGMGSLPTVVNPAAASILGTPAEVVETVYANLNPGGGLKSADQFSAFLNPLAQAAIKSATRVDPFTKQKVDPKQGFLGLAAEEMYSPAAPWQLYKRLTGEVDPKKVNPDPVGDAGGLFVLGGIGDRAYNPKAARNQAASEAKDALDPVERLEATHREGLEGIAEALAAAGVTQGKRIPRDLMEALNTRQARRLALKRAEQKKGDKLTAEERLKADLAFMVERRLLSARDAAEVHRALKDAPQERIDGVRSQFGRYLGGSVISAYSEVLTASGGTNAVFK